MELLLLAGDSHPVLDQSLNLGRNSSLQHLPLVSLGECQGTLVDRGLDYPRGHLKNFIITNILLVKSQDSQKAFVKYIDNSETWPPS